MWSLAQDENMAEGNDDTVGKEDEDVAGNTDEDGNDDQEDRSEAEAWFFVSPYFLSCIFFFFCGQCPGFIST